MKGTFPSAQERVEQERHSVVRQSLELLVRSPSGIEKEETRRFVVALMLDSVMKQARWSGTGERKEGEDMADATKERQGDRGESPASVSPAPKGVK